MEKIIQNIQNFDAGSDHPDTERIMAQITCLRSQIYTISLESDYIPNSGVHQMKWTGIHHSTAFASSIPETAVREIMELDNISSMFKIFALMGIGLLVKSKPAGGVTYEKDTTRYDEIIKRLVGEQKIYLILASSDFIYGLNYQCYHGIIGKDLLNMTPQKTLQAMGRIARFDTTSQSSIRFRNDDMILPLLLPSLVNKEAMKMCELFTHSEN